MPTPQRLLLLTVMLLALAGSVALGEGLLPDATPYAPDCATWGWWYYPWTGYSLESVPYYAMHPPVYYSCPVPRTYGYSPFPYPPGTRTPEIVLPQPKVIQNKYVPQPSPAAPKPERMTYNPVRIPNPFFASTDGRSSSEAIALTSSQGIRPQVVYPARLAQPL